RFSRDWSSDVCSSDLLDDVHAALKQFTPLRIKQRLNETLDLPPLPETARRIIELRIDPNAYTSSLAQVIELDPGMSAQVMSWARSEERRVGREWRARG